MAYPFFYNPVLGESFISLDEATSRHVAQVLRMKAGDKLYLTDGMGKKQLTSVAGIAKKEVTVKVELVEHTAPGKKHTTMAMAVLKNASRMEWFIEKATEMGTTKIILLQTQRTEKHKIRLDRLHNIAVSAMLQSQQSWLPEIVHLNWNEFLAAASAQTRFIAHCIDEPKLPVTSLQSETDSIVVAIGPEGDFTLEEIAEAKEKNFVAVSLGAKRLRTETAALVAASFINIS